MTRWLVCVLLLAGCDSDARDRWTTFKDGFCADMGEADLVANELDTLEADMRREQRRHAERGALERTFESEALAWERFHELEQRRASIRVRTKHFARRVRLLRTGNPRWMNPIPNKVSHIAGDWTPVFCGDRTGTQAIECLDESLKKLETVRTRWQRARAHATEACARD